MSIPAHVCPLCAMTIPEQSYMGHLNSHAGPKLGPDEHKLETAPVPGHQLDIY